MPTGGWKIGKWMPLSDRAFSINTYILSKLWYRAGAIDIKKGDITNIYSAIKTWMYADTYLKPQEEILIREVHEGGLGLSCIESKCRATLTVTFLQAAIIPDYSRNNYLCALYDYFVCNVGSKKINRPPYYSDLFFKSIKEAKEN